MAWQDQLRKASFRGVPFYVDGAEGVFGRRTVPHEYPQRDKPYVEDLGRKARTLTVEALVLGDEYMAARDRLLDAIEQAGPGTLVHPYLGELSVSVTECKLRESTAEGGVARFTLTCIESGEVTFPTQVADTAGAVTAAADAAEVQATAAFEEAYAVSEKPEYVAEESRSILGQAMDGIEAATRTAGMASSEVAAIVASVRAVNQQIITTIYSPASTAQALVDNMKALISASTIEPIRALQLAKTFFTFGSDFLPVPLSDPDGGTVTASRMQQATNQAAMTGLVRQMAVIEASRAATLAEFDSYQHADTVRTDLADAIDGIVEAGVSDGVYDAMMALRAAVVRDITARGADLARVVSYTPNATMPALVLAYALYGDAQRDADIAARNGVRHPGFLPGGEALEVLSDA